LDASFGMIGGAKIFKRLPEYSPGKQISAVLLDLRRAENAQSVKLNLDFIDGLRWKDLYRVMFAKAYHGDFTEWGMIAWKLKIPMPSNPYGHTRQAGYSVNEDTCHLIRAFLDAQLKHKVSTFDDEFNAMKRRADIYAAHGTSPEQHKR
jgi:hypothetical protein